MTALPYPDPPLTDGAVVLRRWERGDLGCVEEASRDSRIPEGTTVPAVFTEGEGLAWIERQWSRAETGQGLSLAIADARTDRAAGVVVVMARPRAIGEVGYWIVERARGERRASRALTLLSRWAFREALFARLEALVEPDNLASQRVLERAGFTREGLLRSYLALAGRRADALIYALLPADLS